MVFTVRLASLFEMKLIVGVAGFLCRIHACILDLRRKPRDHYLVGVLYEIVLPVAWDDVRPNLANGLAQDDIKGQIEYEPLLL